MLLEIERRKSAGRAAVLECRAEGDPPFDGATPPAIVGYAAVFNKPSEDDGLGFREIIMPGAFDRALRERHDVRALVNHDPNQLLGRTKSGTLALSVDVEGLKVDITPPDTGPARDCLTSIKRGDLDGMSFAFRAINDRWRPEPGPDGLDVRELLDLELVDVSVVAYPAYQATSVSTRALAARAAVHAARQAPAQEAPAAPVLEASEAVADPLQEAPPAGVPHEVNAARLAMEAQS